MQKVNFDLSNIFTVKYSVMLNNLTSAIKNKFSLQIKKISIFFLIFLLLFSTFSPFIITAKAVWYDQGFVEFGTKVFNNANENEIFGERYTFAQVTWIGWSIVYIMMGLNSSNLGEFLEWINNGQTGTPPGEEEQSNTFPASFKGSAIGMGAQVIDSILTTPPASAAVSLRYDLQNFSIIPVANAQASPGFGFEALGVIRNMWKAMRNLAYLLLTVLIVVLAMAIMFRVKINPQTAVTIQSALPKIVIVVLLITFSYAIAGLMIDFMYLLLNVFYYSLQTFGGLTKSASTASEYVQEFGSGVSFLEVLAEGLFGFIQVAPTESIVQLILAIVAIYLGSETSSFGAALMPLVIALLLGILAYIIRVIIMLAKSYLTLIINVIFGPIMILTDLLPGKKQETAFSSWIRAIATSLLTFLGVGILLGFSEIIKFAIGDYPNDVWLPPKVGSSTIINFGSKPVLRGIISLAVLAVLPEMDKIAAQLVNSRLLPINPPQDFSGVSRALQGIAEQGMKARQQGGTEKGTQAGGGTPTPGVGTGAAAGGGIPTP